MDLTALVAYICFIIFPMEWFLFNYMSQGGVFSDIKIDPQVILVNTNFKNNSTFENPIYMN